MHFADFKAERIRLALFDGLNDSGTTDVKMDRSVLNGAIAKTASRKTGAYNCSIKLFSSEVPLNLYSSTVESFMEYCCHVWAGTLSGSLNMLNKLQKEVCKTVGSSFPTSL